MRRLAALALLAAAVAATPAAAALNITNVAIDTPGSRSGTVIFNGYAQDVSIGRLLLTGKDTVTNASVSIHSFCIDLFHNAGPGVFTDSNGSTASFDATKKAQLGALLTNTATLIKDQTSSAAAQLAVWEIVYETGSTSYDLSKGALSGTGTDSAAARTQANTWLNFITTGKWVGDATLQYHVLSADNNQTQLYATPGTNVTAVPEPASWAMLIAGFGLIGTSMRRRPARMLHAI